MREELSKAKARERVGEMNAAISTFTEDEKAYAKDEIDAFNANPIESEINTVVNKIWEGIGKKAKATEPVVETNAATEIEDIFSGVIASAASEEYTSIF